MATILIAAVSILATTATAGVLQSTHGPERQYLGGQSVCSSVQQTSHGMFEKSGVQSPEVDCLPLDDAKIPRAKLVDALPPAGVPPAFLVHHQNTAFESGD